VVATYRVPVRTALILFPFLVPAVMLPAAFVATADGAPTFVFSAFLFALVTDLLGFAALLGAMLLRVVRRAAAGPGRP
jgi:hypothetical protein